MSVYSKMTAIGDAIRAKTGGTSLLTLDEMESEIRSISDLNFEVVGGTTEPANPTENTIWVNSPTDITGYYFSYTQPENMLNGDVWFPTSDDSSAAFNALKDNCIKVCPIRAMQMVNSALVEVESKTYMNGAWVEWFAYLYDSGNEFVDLTGGIVVSKTSPGSATKNSDHIAIRGVGKDGADTHIAVYTKNKIDLTNFKTLTINEDALLSKSAAGSNPWMCVLSAPPTSFSVIHGNGNSVIAFRLLKDGNVLDLTDISGKYYVAVTCTFSGSANYYANVDIKSLVLR